MNEFEWMDVIVIEFTTEMVKRKISKVVNDWCSYGSIR